MHSKTIRAGLFITLILFGCVASRAQETPQIAPEKRALIKELLELLGGTKSTNQLMDIMLQQQERELPQVLSATFANDKNLTPAEKAAAEQQIKESIPRTIARMKEALQKINFAQTIEDISAAIFDKYFSESELREWVAFYKTPLGKKTIELMPTIYAESMTRASENVLPALQEEMNKIIADETARLEKELKHATAPPPQRTKRKG
jgi:hypothetical protein